MDLSSGAVWGALGAIIVANILLSGDNAVVIAMAARSLPPHQQKKAIFWGSAAAIVLRIVLTIAAVQLLQLPYLKIIGAAALLLIGVQLLTDSEEEGEVKSEGTLGAAVRTILIADLVMSIDNVIAVAGAADRAPPQYRVPLLVVGLALSIPLIIAGSTMLMKVMERWADHHRARCRAARLSGRRDVRQRPGPRCLVCGACAGCRMAGRRDRRRAGGDHRQVAASPPASGTGDLSAAAMHNSRRRNPFVFPCR